MALNDWGAGMFLRKITIAAGFVLATSSVAFSADYSVPAEDGTDFIFELGVGGRLEPEYEGSDEYTVTPFPIFDVEYLNLPGLFALGSPNADGTGFHFGPAVNVVGKRDAGDFHDLDGLDDVDATYELGLRAGYEWQWAEIWGELRYGLGGAEGFVGGFGANLILRPSEDLRFKIGPFATLADDNYTGDYFSVSAAESAKSGLQQFDADGGFKSVGVWAETRWEFSPDWFATVDASYSRLVGDAGDSPITDAGSEDQFTVGLGLSKRFAVDLF
ncbi:MipA/OmpV family protein [soil metagenome]